MGLTIFILSLVLVVIFAGQVRRKSVFMVDGSGRQYYLGYEILYTLLDWEFTVWRRIKGRKALCF